MARSLSPVQKTIAYLKDNGVICGICERWIPNPKHPGGGFRSDFLNIIDLIAVSKADGIVGYQVCGTDYASHVTKITVERAEETRAWLEAGGRLVIVGWRKVKKIRGGTQMIWKPRIQEITLKDLEETTNDQDH